MAHSDSHHAPRPSHDISPSPPLLPPFDAAPDPTLADYLLVLARRKRLIALIVGFSLVAGLAHAWLSTRVYTVQTAIEIGRASGDKLIDPPETILAKLTHAYIPDALQSYRSEQPGNRANVRISAKIPKGSEVVVLESRGPLDAEPVHRALHVAVSERLVRDHQRTVDQIVRQYESELSRAKLKLDELSDHRVFIVQEKLLQGEIDRGQLRLAALRDQAKLIETEAKRFDETKQLLTQQVADLRADIASATTHRTGAAPEATDGARAMTLLMIDNQIADSRALLRSLEERLHISLENDREKLLKQLADVRRDQEAQIAALGELGSKLVKLRVDNEREKALQRQAIDDIEFKLASVRATRVIMAPSRSLDPVGVGRTTVLALYVTVGLFLGVFSAFVAEFLSQAKIQHRTLGNGTHPDPDAEVETVVLGAR